MGDFKVILRLYSMKEGESESWGWRTYIHFLVQSWFVASPFKAFRTPSPGFQTNSRLTLSVWGYGYDGGGDSEEDGRDRPPENLSNRGWFRVIQCEMLGARLGWTHSESSAIWTKPWRGLKYIKTKLKLKLTIKRTRINHALDRVIRLKIRR